MKNIITLLIIIFHLCSFGQGTSNGLSFDGINDFIRLDSYTLVKSHSTNTIEMWVKSSATETGVIYSEGFLDSYYRGQFRLFGNGSGKLSLYYYPANTSILINNVTSTSTVFDGTWHHIALVGNGNSTILYVDGVPDVTNFNYVRPLTTEQTGSKFGAQAQCCGFSSQFSLPYSGLIDEIRLWSTNRSQTEIRDNMCQKLIGNESNLEVYYPLNQELGIIATDFSTATIRDGNIDYPNLTTPYAAWVLSGAPVGNESIHDYSVSLSTSLNIAAAAGDDLTTNITAIGTTPLSIHVYRVDNAPDNATPPGTQNQLSTTTYYGVKVFGGTGVTHTVIYNYDGHIGINDESTLELAKRNDNADLTWNQESPTLNTTANTLTLTGQTGTEYILADKVSNPLPIELIKFNANYVDEKYILLDWQTASESNNDYFTVERSQNGVKWGEVVSINGAGNSSDLLNYSTIDDNPYFGVSYYRLKQIDFNGKFSYSQIKSVNTNILENLKMEIFPNPADDQITITGNESDLKQVEIYNTHGQNVTALTTFNLSDKSKLLINLSNLNAGMYYIKTKTTTNKVYKE